MKSNYPIVLVLLLVSFSTNSPSIILRGGGGNSQVSSLRVNMELLALLDLVALPGPGDERYRITLGLALESNV